MGYVSIFDYIVQILKMSWKPHLSNSGIMFSKGLQFTFACNRGLHAWIWRLSRPLNVASPWSTSNSFGELTIINLGSFGQPLLEPVLVYYHLKT